MKADDIIVGPSTLVSAICERLMASIKESLESNEGSGPFSIYFNQSQYDAACCLVYLVSNGQNRVNKKDTTALRSLVEFLDSCDRYGWIDTFVPRVAFELADGQPATGLDILNLNMNHKKSLFRARVFEIAWLIRPRLDALISTERILFNVGAGLGGYEDGIAILWEHCSDDRLFWDYINLYRPSYWSTEQYGTGLSVQNPHLSEETLQTELSKFRDPSSELASYVLAPTRLQDFERRIVEDILPTFQTYVAQTRMPL